MNKAELASAAAERSGLPPKDAGAYLTAVIEAVVEAVAAGEKVRLPGFGSFEGRKRKARTYRNPQNGGRVKVAEHVVPCFKAGISFKDAVAAAAAARMQNKRKRGRKNGS